MTTAAVDNSALYQSLGLKTTAQVEKSTQNTNSAELMQEDFLTLMTTQLKNQDPMAPMESGEFLGQMAQFGSVKGINDLNSSFKSLADSLYSNQALTASSLVGKSALVAGSSGELVAEGSLKGAVNLTQSVGDLSLIVTDSSGNPVRRLNLGTQPEGMVDFNWDGRNESGEPLPAGRYQVAAEAVSNGINTRFETFIEGEIKSVSLSAGGGQLSFNVGGMGDLTFADLKQVRK